MLAGALPLANAPRVLTAVIASTIPAARLPLIVAPMTTTSMRQAKASLVPPLTIASVLPEGKLDEQAMLGIGLAQTGARVVAAAAVAAADLLIADAPRANGAATTTARGAGASTAAARRCAVHMPTMIVAQASTILSSQMPASHRWMWGLALRRSRRQ